MIKKEFVRVEAVAAHDKEITKCICDFCFEPTGSWQTCVSCGKQVCRRLTKSCRMFDPNEPGDYPDPYCPICYEIRFERLENDYQKVEAERDLKIEELDKRVRELSLEEYAKKFPEAKS